MYIVTGATGRLGTHLVRALLNKGKEVKALVRSDKEEVPKKVVSYVGDITKPETLAGLVRQNDTVFHLAGIISTSSSENLFYDINVLGTENMLNACRGKNIRRFVFVSSISVFGVPAELPADETCAKRPISKYGKSKMLAEEIITRKKKILPISILRPGMIYGPGFDEGYFAVLGILEKRNIPIFGSIFFGDGNNHIPIVHVSDVVDALLLLSEHDEADGQDFNLIGPDSLTQRELFSLACRELGVEEPKHSLPNPIVNILLKTASLFGKSNISEEHLRQLTMDRVFDNSKIRKKLGFEPKIRASQGIKEMVAYYRKRKVML